MNEKHRPDGGGRRAGLRLIPGGRTRRLRLAGRTIVLAPEKDLPFDLDALVFEEDTYRIMSAEPEWAPPEEHPLRIMHDLHRYAPDRPGTVVVQAGRPLRLLAIVHDVNCEPTWRREWVAAALHNVFRAAVRHGLVSIGLPLLGSRHGRLETRTFVDLLGAASANNPGRLPLRLWVIVPDPESGRIMFEGLKSWKGA